MSASVCGDLYVHVCHMWMYVYECAGVCVCVRACCICVCSWMCIDVNECVHMGI